MADCEGKEDGIVERRNITSQKQFKSVLHDFFDIKLDDEEDEKEGVKEGVAVCPPGTIWEDV